MSETVTSVFDKDEAKHFTYYDVELTFTDQLLGGIPKDPHIVASWLGVNAGVVQPEDVMRERLITTVRDLGFEVGELKEKATWDELTEAIDELVGTTKTQGFKMNGHGLFVEDRQVKAMLKESANVVYPATTFYHKDTLKPLPTLDTKKGKGLRSLVAEFVYIDPREILLGREKPDSVELRVTHAQNRSSLGYFEAVNKPVLNFRVKVLHDLIPQEMWAAIWVHAQSNGQGASRSQGYGQFKVTRWQRVKP